MKLKHLGKINLMSSNTIPPGTIYAVSNPEFIGKMPIRHEMTILSADWQCPVCGKIMGEDFKDIHIKHENDNEHKVLGIMEL